MAKTIDVSSHEWGTIVPLLSGGNVDAFEKVLMGGLDPNTRITYSDPRHGSWTLLHSAVQASRYPSWGQHVNFVNMIKLLVRHKANPLALNDDRSTPLDDAKASCHSRPENAVIVQVLVEAANGMSSTP